MRRHISPIRLCWRPTSTQTRTLLSQLPGSVEDRMRFEEGFEAFIPAPITTIHLWYDRDVTELDHAVLLDTRIQWVFTKSRIRRWPKERGSYQELVISASWQELEMGRGRDPGLRSGRVRDVLSCRPPGDPGEERRPQGSAGDLFGHPRAGSLPSPAGDAVKGLYPLLATGLRPEWPSTMEGAVRSGRLAAGAVTGNRLRFMAPELPATGLMKLF